MGKFSLQLETDLHADRGKHESVGSGRRGWHSGVFWTSSWNIRNFFLGGQYNSFFMDISVSKREGIRPISCTVNFIDGVHRTVFAQRSDHKLNGRSSLCYLTVLKCQLPTSTYAPPAFSITRPNALLFSPTIQVLYSYEVFLSMQRAIRTKRQFMMQEELHHGRHHVQSHHG